MKRDECFRVLAQAAPENVVVATYTSAFEWIAIRPHPLNYVAVGAMGLASSHGLGLACALPYERILVLDGDGSLLMNLGTLVTVAGAKPRNLVHFVVQNGTYEANGGHPIPAKDQVDFVAMALGAGYSACHEIVDLDDFRLKLPEILTQEGPVFVCLHVVPGDRLPAYDYPFIHGERARLDFESAIRLKAA